MSSIVKLSPHLIAVILVSAACGVNHAHSQGVLVTEQAGLPALFEEVSAAAAAPILQNDPNLQGPFYDRIRILKVRSESLRREADVEESSPLYLNLFPDLGLRIYLHGRIDRQYGFDWFASPYPEYDGRTFVNLIDTIGAHAYSGMRVEMNLQDPRFDGIHIAQINGTDLVAVIESREVPRSEYPTAPALSIWQSSSLVLSEPHHSFVAEAGVRVDYSGLDAYFASEKVGYFITAGGAFHPYPSKLYRTTDGGRGWTLINDAVPGTPFKIHFTDVNVGYLLLRALPSCQRVEDCRGISVLRKTTDGGKTWLGFDHSEFVGAPEILDVRIEDRLYAMVQRRSAGGQTSLAVSTDGAETWTDVYAFSSADRVVRATAAEGNILVGFQSGQLFVVDVAAGQAEALAVPGNQLIDFRAPSLDAIYVETQNPAGGQLLVTTDRGASWRSIREGWFQFIAAPSDEELLLIVNKGSSGPSDTATSSDVIAYSDDAGATWEETVLIGGLIITAKRAQSLSSRVHKVMLHERVLTILTAPRD